MYSKVYWIACNPGEAEDLMHYYDAEVVPAIEDSEYHFGHHMVQSGENKWLLVSNYKDEEAAEAAQQMVQEIVAPMAEKYGMTLELITEGVAVRSF